ncbi:hypothetical protein PRIPAC_76292 [Pristionchus pacificus]|uniref:Uncharacterized protein n=1 Tax=Pristionchus pacificus TaxID=54126 RepID=A0A2A6CZY8_PRIPA|nr:hypothetical protein PRIPAC_71730 [Pristionchus pacificus]KAF8384180.1 hypothetical protein PRIPAC_73322 [Pristionchus pacificus]KAF8384334.1 hypothetical protein PRIPAC_73476 [Pristionchus pacificus]KAF8387150.1 hypothetical protein PRIPAC_76292 [Pristionchus pacificus]|eukprot:PDM83525.1 hypothetical protein PRIPAC_30012 [Pristionchus pacificus]
MIPPSEENLDKYEKLTDGDIDFFGYHVNKCVRIELQAGDSLIMPSDSIRTAPNIRMFKRRLENHPIIAKLT